MTREECSAASVPVDVDTLLTAQTAALSEKLGCVTVHQDQEFLVSVATGPTTRQEYHVSPSGELFFQIRGTLRLRLKEDAGFRDVVVGEGEFFALAARTPHLALREAGSRGLVVQRLRHEGELDGLRWYCQSCHEVLYEEFFQMQDIEGQVAHILGRFEGTDALRTCPRCSAVYGSNEG